MNLLFQIKLANYFMVYDFKGIVFVFKEKIGEEYLLLLLLLFLLLSLLLLLLLLLLLMLLSLLLLSLLLLLLLLFLWLSRFLFQLLKYSEKRQRYNNIF